MRPLISDTEGSGGQLHKPGKQCNPLAVYKLCKQGGGIYPLPFCMLGRCPKTQRTGTAGAAWNQEKTGAGIPARKTAYLRIDSCNVMMLMIILKMGMV